MLKEEVPGGIRSNNNPWGRVCDTCHSSPCHVYCHVAPRVWMCEACERAPAAFLCKADAASLCATCDADIHSANPLARRHQRVPIVPGGGTHRAADVAAGSFFEEEEEEEGDEEEAASWLILNHPTTTTTTTKPNNNNNNNGSSNNNNNGFLLGGEVDGYLDLFEYNNNGNGNGNGNNNVGNHQMFEQQCNGGEQQEEFSVPEKSCGGDSVVPVQCGEGNKELQYQNFLFGMDQCETKSGYSYGTSFSHSVSVSSMDVGVVPDSTLSDISLSHPRPPKGTIDLFSNPPMQIPTQLSPMDREARVMRYREKKKNRKFEKTIRYASRKAYAETRPRIKGRFAKRSDVEAEMDQMFPNSLMSDGGYGIVPSF